MCICVYVGGVELISDVAHAGLELVVILLSQASEYRIYKPASTHLASGTF